MLEVIHSSSRADSPPAVVVGLCTHGLAIARSLGRRGVPVHALESNRRLPGTRSRFAEVTWAPDINGPSLVEELVTLAKKLPPRPVLFLTNDNMVRQICTDLKAILHFYRFNFPAPELVLRLLDKRQLAEWAVERGFRYPQTFYVSSQEEIHRLAGGLSYPVALKPAQPLSNFKARQASNADELMGYFRRYFDGTTLLIQEWVSGTERSIYFCNYIFDYEGRPLAQFVGRKIRSFPRLTGGASSAEPSERHDLLSMGLRFFEGAKIRGPAAVEFKEAPDGTMFVIEPTIGRFDFYIHCCTLNGVDMPYLSYRSMIGDGKTLEESSETKRKSTAWVDFELDFPVFVDSLLSTNEFRSSLTFMFRKKGFALWAPDDPWPSFHAWPRSLLRYARKFARRLPYASSRSNNDRPGITTRSDQTGIEVVTSYSGLVSLKREWDSYSELEGNQSIFLTHDWFENFAHEILNEDSMLSIHVLRGRDGRGAIFPMMLERAWMSGAPILRLKLLSNFYSPIAKPLWFTKSFDERVELARTFLAHSRTTAPKWTVLDFSPIPEETGDLDVLTTALERERILHTTYFASGNWYRPVGGLERANLNSWLPSRVKNTIRRRLSRARRHEPVEFRIYTEPRDVEVRIDEYYEVYQRSWKRPEPYSKFHARLAKKLSRHGKIILGIAYFRGRPAAAQLWLIHRRIASILKLCHDEALKQYSFGTILTYEIMTHVLTRADVDEIDYLTGDEPYKRDWMSARRSRFGVLAFGSGGGAFLGLNEVYLKPALKRIIRSAIPG